MIKLYSNIRETATKTKYKINIVNPSPLFIFHRKHAMDMMTNTSIMKRIVMEQTMPTEFTSTGFPYITPYSNQGTGNLENQSIRTLNASRPYGFIINGNSWQLTLGAVFVRISSNLPDCYIEYVAANGRRDSHVTESFPCYDDRSD